MNYHLIIVCRTLYVCSVYYSSFHETYKNNNWIGFALYFDCSLNFSLNHISSHNELILLSTVTKCHPLKININWNENMCIMYNCFKCYWLFLTFPKIGSTCSKHVLCTTVLLLTILFIYQEWRNNQFRYSNVLLHLQALETQPSQQHIKTIGRRIEYELMLMIMMNIGFIYFTSFNFGWKEP